ncbi:hypothetical protein [Microbispora sp. NPDC049125]|uniref:hypothetical protein n=1 Tax=Microbispora sp. NPDC049125 TaxID=3154929 RepID=UPI003467E4AA
MKKIVAVATLAAMTTLGMVAAGNDGQARTGPYAGEPGPWQNPAFGGQPKPTEQPEQTEQSEQPGQPGEPEQSQGEPEQSQGQAQPEPKEQPGGPTLRTARQEVSRDQFEILMGQCRYADTEDARCQCRADVRERYSVGEHNPFLDCRTYSSVSVCGNLNLSPREQACVREAVNGGLTARRAEVECYAFR